MSSNIDNRIVQMQFENSQFEKGVKESLKTLDELKKSLDFKESSKAFEMLQKAGDSFSLAKIAKGIDEVSQRFTLMGTIGRKVFEDIADTAIRTGKQFVKSVSIDQVSAGWTKYGDKTKAVQTIVNATGKDIAYVDEQLSKLAWFTDETSYNFVDMTSNIGKFTSMGIDLETSVTAMEGIATWAAASGQGISEAGRAMYNLSQAIGVGAVKLMDWKSIENANMATKEFKQTAIDAAKALGKLNKEGKTSKGTLVSFENFSQTLSEGWFTKEVLLDVLGKYGEYADEVYKIVAEEGITAAEAMERVNAETMKLGEKAFKAAQEAKTFEDAIESVKDAVSTGWMSLFENLFGNYEEAKVLWTDLANWLWDVFAAPLSDTNELLAKWKELGGRETALKGIYDIFHALTGVINAVSDAMAEIFPPLTVEQLLAASDAIAELGKNIRQTFFWGEFEYDYPYVEKMVDLGELIEENTFKLGDESDAVKTLQDELVKLGYLQEYAANGKFNVQTQKALENYQNGVKALYTSLDRLDNPFKLGDKSKEVEEFQKKLIELGYDVGKSGADGVYGHDTEKAFKEYEASLKGVEQTRRELKRKDEGEDVKELQQKLIDAKLLDEGQADGIFGPNTERALKEWQEAHELTASGILDTDTINAMFPEEAKGQIQWMIGSFVEYGDTLERLQRISKGAFAALSILKTVFGFLGNVVGVVLNLLSPLGDALLEITATIGDAFVNLDTWLKESGKLEEWLASIKEFLSPIGDLAQEAADGLLKFFGVGKDGDGKDGTATFKSIFESIETAVENSGALEKITGAFDKLKVSFEKIKAPLKGYWKSFKEAFGKKFNEIAGKIPGAFTNIVNAVSDFITKAVEKISPWVEKIPGQVQKIKDFFKAFFDAGDEGKGVKRGFGSKILDFLKNTWNSILGFVGNLPDTAGKVWTVIKEFYDSLKLSEKFESLSPKLISIWEKVKEFFSKLSEGVKAFFDTDTSGIEGFGEKLKARLAGFAGIGEWISEKFTAIVTSIKNVLYPNSDSGVLSGVGKNVGSKSIFERLSEMFGNAWEGLTVFFDKFRKIADKMLMWTVIGVSIVAIIRLIGSITGVFKKLKDVIGSYKKNAQNLSETVKEFAIAIGIIAASIWLIGQLKPYQLARSIKTLVGIVVVIGALTTLAGIFMKGDPSKAIKKLGHALFEFASALGILVGVVVVLSIIPWEVLGRGALALSGLMVLVGLFMLFISKTIGKDINIQMKGLIGLAGMIAILAVVIGYLGNMKSETAENGMTRLGHILIMLIALMGATRLLAKGALKKAGPILSVAVLIGILAGIIAILGSLNDEQAAKGISRLWTGVIIPLMALMGATRLLGKNTIKTGPIVAMAAAVGMMAAIIVILGKMSGETLAKGFITLTGIVGLLFLFSLAMRLLGKSQIKPGPILALIGVMLVMTGAVAVLGSMSGDTLLKGFAALTGIVAILMLFALSTRALTKSNVKVGPVIAMIVAMGAMVAAVAILGSMSVESLAKGVLGLLTLVGVLFLLKTVLSSGSGDFKKSLTMIVSSVAIAIAMIAFAHALKKLTFVKTDKIYAFAIGLSAVFLAFGGLSAIANSIGVGGILMGALAIVGLAAGITAAVIAVSAILEIPGVDNLINGGMEKVGKFIGTFIGSMKAAEIKAFGEGIKGITGIPEVDQEALDNIIDCATKFSNFQNGIKDYTFIEQAFVKLGWLASDMELFSRDMVNFAQGIKLFNSSMTLTPQEATDLSAKTTTVVDIAGKISKFNNDLEGQYTGAEKFISLFKNKSITDMANFVGDLTLFGKGIDNFVRIMNGVTVGQVEEGKVTTAVSIAEQVSTLNKGLTGQYSLFEKAVTLFSNKSISEMALFAGDLTLFGKGIDNFVRIMNGVTVGQVEQGKVTTAVSIAEQVSTVNKGLTGQYSLFERAVTLFKNKSVTEMALFAGDLTLFGKGMENIASALSGVDGGVEFDSESAQKAVDIANQIADLNTNLKGKYPEDGFGKLITWLTGTEMKQFSGDMSAFGEGIESFGSSLNGLKLSGINPLKVAMAIGTTQQVANFLSTLSGMKFEHEKGVLQKFFEGENAQGTVFDALGKLATSMNDNKTSFESMSDGTLSSNITKAIAGMQSIAEFLVYLGDEKINLAIGDSYFSFETLKGRIQEIADFMATFNEVLADKGISDPALISAIAATWQAFADLFNGEKINTKNFLGDLDAKAVAAKLEQFTTQLGETIGASTETITGYSDSFNSAGNELASSAISGVGSADTSKAGGVAESMLRSVSGYTDKFRQTGVYFGLGLAKGVGSTARLAGIAAAAVAKKMVEEAMRELDESSPSKVAIQIGSYFTEGLAQGTTSKIKMAEESSGEVAESMLNVAKGTMTSLSSILSEGINDNPTIRPVVDMSSTRAAASAIDGMFGTKSFALQSTIAASASINPKTGRPNTNQNGSENVVAAVQGMGGQISALGNAIQNMQMVVDSGALVGQISNKMDRKLGQMATMKARRI